MRVLIVLAAALVFAGTAAAHIPFDDGPRAARQMAASLGKSKDMEKVSCRYVKPHVVCKGLVLWEGDSYLRFTAHIHKTAPKVGYGLVCITFFGICEKRPMKFSS